MPFSQTSQPRPQARGSAIPIVLDESDIVLQQVESEEAQGAQIQVLDIKRARLENDLNW